MGDQIKLIDPVLNNIPERLKEFDQWVVWNAVERVKKDGSIKISKEPCNVKSGKQASAQDSKNWLTFEEASNAFMFGGFSGIGFVFTEQDPFVGIDIDGCIEGKKVSDLAKMAVNTCRSFAEVSVSGTGVHIIGEAEMITDGIQDHALGVEMYSGKRYLTITAKTFSKYKDIVPMQEAVDVLFDEWFGEKSLSHIESGGYEFDTDAPVIPVEVMPIRDELKSLVKDGKGVSRYKKAGDESGEGDRSQALFFAAKEMIDYGINKESVITCFTNASNFLGEVALDRRKGNIASARQWLWKYIVGRVIAYREQQKDEYDEVTDIVKEQAVSIDREGKKHLDITDSVKTNIEYKKNDHEYNGGLFVANHPIMNINQNFYYFNGVSYQSMTPHLIDSMVQISMSGNNIPLSQVNNVLTYVKRTTTKGEFRHDQTRFAFSNGVMDVHGWESGTIDKKLVPSSPNYRILGSCNVDYDPNAQCPNFKKFLKSQWGNDSECIELLISFLFYAIFTRSYKYQKFLMMCGASRSGKGTLLEIIYQIIGDDNYASTSLSALANTHGMAQLVDKKVAVIPDAKDASRNEINKATESLLTITGNDIIAVNQKNRDEYKCRLDARMIIACNGAPVFAEASNAVGNRMLALPFFKSFANKEDLNLRDKLMAELPGIINYILEEGPKYIKKNNGFKVPESAKSIYENFQERTSPETYFIDQYMVKDTDGKIAKSELYDLFTQFNDSQNKRTFINKNQFGRNVVSHIETAYQPDENWDKGKISATENNPRRNCYSGFSFDHKKFNEDLDDYL